MIRQLARRCCQTLADRYRVLRIFFWQQSLRSRILIIALVPSLLTAGLLSSQLIRQKIAETEHNMSQELLSATRHMAATGQYPLISGDINLLQLTVEKERSQENLAFACVQDVRDSVRYCSGTTDLDALIPFPAIGEIVKKEPLWVAAYPILLPDAEMDSGFEVSSQSTSRVVGYAVSAVSTESLVLSKRRALQIAASLIVASLALTAFLAWRLSTTLTRRVQHLSDAVDRIAGGNLQIRVNPGTSTELGVLESGINRMAESLQTHQDEMHVRIIHATADLAAKKDEAERANTTKSRFFAAASHDLRQPLHALGLFGEALKQRVTTSELSTLAHQISSSISSLESLLNALLDVSRLDAGAIEVRKRHFPVSQLFDHIGQQFEGPATAKGIRLKVRPSNWILYSDPILLERVLINLVSNALRYTNSGRILVSGRKRGNAMLIQVWDTGIGIPQNALDSIFEEYVQLNNPDRDREKGLGLGLAIVSRTANLLGSQIRVRSRLNHGSVFSIEVPLGSTLKVAPAENPALSVGASLQGQLAALVDDEIPILNAMETLFSTWGVSIVTGRDGEEVLEQFEKLGKHPDFLITDYSLQNNKNGIDVARQFQEKFGADLPVLVLTGDTSPDTLQLITQAGYRVIHKPVRPARLRAALAHILDKDASG